MNEWKKKLTSLRNGRLQPSQEWASRNREVLLAQIRNTVHAPEKEKTKRFQKTWLVSMQQAMRLFLSVRFLAVGRSVSIASLAGLLAVGGWIASVSASYDSLPGEALYHVKVAAENAELLVATMVGDDKAKVETLLKHASNRVEEVQNSKTANQATVAIASLKKSIASANKTLESAEENSDPGAAELAKVVTQKTDQLLESIETVSDASKELGEAAHLIEVAGVRAVEVLVEQNLAGNADVSLAEVKASVEKKLGKIVTDISTLNNDVVSSTALFTVSTTPLTISSTTKDMTVSSSTATTAAEAQTLIDNNDLLGAIKKVQTLTEVKKDAGTAVLEAKLIVEKNAALNAASTTPATPTTTAGSP